MKHLVIIIDRDTRKTLAEYEIEAADFYYARHIGCDKFRKEHPDAKNFAADSIELE